MKTVPNQRVITILKTDTTREKHFAAIDMEALFEAMYNLKSFCGFKLYMYLAKNKQNYIFALSSQDFMNCANCSKSAYTTAFNELVEKVYLIAKAGTETRFLFIDKTGKCDKPKANSNESIEPNYIDYVEQKGKKLFDFDEIEKGYNKEQSTGFVF